jgi:general secretion pathway protein J
MTIYAAKGEACSGEDGFTIVEALVAITLFSLLSLLVISALRFGTSAWYRSYDISAEIDETVQVQALLRRLIEGASPKFVPLPAGKGYVDFGGNSHSLDFISDPPRSLDNAGRLIMSLAADTQNGRHDFTIATRPEIGSSTIGSAVTRRVLLQGVESVSFSYFGAKRRGGGAQWHSDWTKETTLPALVRVDVKLASTKTVSWPEMIIAPRIDVDVSCIYDTLTRGCRGR